MTRERTIANRPLTPRGAATKQRIVEAAAELIYLHGAENVSLDTVMDVTNTSKSQLYHYFANKQALIRDVIDLQTSRIVAANAQSLGALDSFVALRAWGDMIIAAFRAGGGIGGCPIGSLANELATRSEEARLQLRQSFSSWSSVIENGLCRMRRAGQLDADTDVAAMAVAMVAAVQGGIVLAKTSRETRPLELAIDMALAHVKRHAGVAGRELPF
ncbi:transcriptional regulator [Neoasaia chiangmaiensis NBRC 101099]|uniref:TetR family transcriptional regulator n=1 Tax=Neoasaia chiangmaiensis TaxID=320497 RepID=A0A1U9KQB2_9PROT|nr:TetR/AcrR family transcriptional regulator [Neoasaia chiangmaiensis]AQS87975.1 TetR family transcriptional regulator [Neoasaia chiangmaiensis]GBR38925.1 transcriptional regulator [Neoasaia chiangmaiensis NBRC 101099]GEN15636.1 transcriptional regulator [Neoasaia chiangmaiensis]